MKKGVEIVLWWCGKYRHWTTDSGWGTPMDDEYCGMCRCEVHENGCGMRARGWIERGVVGSDGRW